MEVGLVGLKEVSRRKDRSRLIEVSLRQGPHFYSGLRNGSVSSIEDLPGLGYLPLVVDIFHDHVLRIPATLELWDLRLIPSDPKLGVVTSLEQAINLDSARPDADCWFISLRQFSSGTVGRGDFRFFFRFC